MRRILFTFVFAVLLPGCATMQNTLAQDLAWERWEKCRISGVNVSRIEPTGRIWVTYPADDGRALREWQECDRKAAAEQGQRRSPAQATAAGASTDRGGHAAVAADATSAPTWKVGHEWAYRYDQPSGTGTFTWRVDRTEMLDNRPHWVIKTGTREIFYRHSDLAYSHETVEGQLVRRVTPAEWRFLAFPLVVGRSWEMKYEDSRPLDRQIENIERRCTVEAEEPLTVPAGAFQTLRVRCTNMRDGAWVMTLWYAPAVGHAIREESAVVGGRRLRELIAYKLR
jgi:hypothetical protein